MDPIAFDTHLPIIFPTESTSSFGAFEMYLVNMSIAAAETFSSFSSTSDAKPEQSS